MEFVRDSCTTAAAATMTTSHLKA